MYLLKPAPRPHASFACPYCRAVNVVEPEDLQAAQDHLARLSCLSCGNDHLVHVGYMVEQLSRDIAN